MTGARDPGTAVLAVVVPTCNRSQDLERCLAALSRQRLAPQEMEVIVVDDSGAVSLPGDPCALTAPIRCRIIRHSQNRGAAAARNSGARAARARFVAFIDDDCTATPEWGREMLQALAASPDDAVAGAIHPAPKMPRTDYVTELLSRPAGERDGTIQRARSANLGFPRIALLAHGGFDESYRDAGYEDYELCLRWRGAGRRIRSAPFAIVHHHRASSLTEFWSQHFRYGRGAWHLYRNGELAPRVPWGSTIGLLGSTVSAGGLPFGWLGHLSLVGLSQAAMVAGFFAERRQRH